MRWERWWSVDVNEMMDRQQAVWQEMICFGAHLDLRLLRDLDAHRGVIGAYLTDEGRAWVKERIAERQAEEQEFIDRQTELKLAELRGEAQNDS